ncbi:hypothetical protein B0H13DRAFT_2312619 [Mycena leptocephala]|nr:hypothetical protein B0H13DRAFT_2312619 [Mycena leptocephala]
MCAPDLGEEGWKKIEKWEDLPHNWPDHFDSAIFILNNRILRALDHTPNELFFGMVINTTTTGVERASEGISIADIGNQIAYTNQQCFDGFSRAVANGRPGRDSLIRKSPAAAQAKLEPVDGRELKGNYSARRLKKLKPPVGSSLEAYEKERERRIAAEETVGADGPPVVFEDEEDASDGPEETDSQDGWEDEEDEAEDGIGERVRRRHRGYRLPGQSGEGGPDVIACLALLSTSVSLTHVDTRIGTHISSVSLHPSELAREC